MPPPIAVTRLTSMLVRKRSTMSARQVRVVLERQLARRVVEAADDQEGDRQQEESDGEDEERHRPSQPRRRRERGAPGRARLAVVAMTVVTPVRAATLSSGGTLMSTPTRRPTPGDQVVAVVQLLERGEHGAGRRPAAWRQVRRDGAAGDHVLVADRVAVALQPEELALVAVQELHPQLGGVGMRRVGADAPGRRRPPKRPLAGTTTSISGLLGGRRRGGTGRCSSSGA